MFSLAFQWLMDLEDFLFGVLSCSSFLLMKVAFSADSWWVSLMFSPSLSLISHKRSTDASHPSWDEEKQYALQDLWDRVGFGWPGFIQLTVWFKAAADTDVTCCVAGIRKVPLYHTAVRDAFPFQNGWIFGKVPKGGGGHFQSKNLYCRFLSL